MNADQQEALSHQHYGYWCVPLASGAIAVFNHPNGKLLAITPARWEEVLKVPIAARPVYTTLTSNLNLGDINDLL